MELFHSSILIMILKRIESPNQLKERIDIIKSDNDFYVKLITELQNKFITENDINGKTISDTIMREFN